MSFLKNQKGQSALEYLMTYGWALVVIVIVIAALVSLNIFSINTAPNTCVFTSFTGINYDRAHAYRSDGTFEMRVLNSSGQELEIVGISMDGTPLTFTDVNILGGSSALLVATDAPTRTEGQPYQVSITIEYNPVESRLSAPVKVVANCTGTIQ